MANTIFHFIIGKNIITSYASRGYIFVEYIKTPRLFHFLTFLLLFI